MNRAQVKKNSLSRASRITMNLDTLLEDYERCLSLATELPKFNSSKFQDEAGQGCTSTSPQPGDGHAQNQGLQAPRLSSKKDEYPCEFILGISTPWYRLDRNNVSSEEVIKLVLSSTK